MPKSFDEALNELVEIASNTYSLPDPSKDLWSLVVGNFEPSGSINGTFCTPVEQMIEHYVRNQSEKDQRSIWSETEAGMIDEENEDCEPIGIEMDLDVSLFEAFMNQAHEESMNLSLRSKQHPSSPRSKRSGY